ncbi:MAG: thiosulfate oxidation carrier complex protein SoxZ [Gammaproteobacteria bacterium]|jgi:sulfur-oxidizing protein SoxZ
MASTIRLRTKLKDNVVTVRAIIRHPMETGFRVDEDLGDLIPAHFIKLVTAKLNGETIFSCDWSRAVSKNPYLSFMFEGAKTGDKLELSWLDTKDKTDVIETII